MGFKDELNEDNMSEEPVVLFIRFFKKSDSTARASQMFDLPEPLGPINTVSGSRSTSVSKRLL
jgi:hypothetical protein